MTPPREQELRRRQRTPEHYHMPEGMRDADLIEKMVAGQPGEEGDDSCCPMNSRS